MPCYVYVADFGSLVYIFTCDHYIGQMKKSKTHVKYM